MKGEWEWDEKSAVVPGKQQMLMMDDRSRRVSLNTRVSQLEIDVEDAFSVKTSA
jgi:hypothetical protein